MPQPVGEWGNPSAYRCDTITRSPAHNGGTRKAPMDVPGKSFNKDLLLSWLLHHMSMETRLRMSAELPAAYNDVMEARVVETVDHDALEAARDGLRRMLRHAGELNGGCSVSDDVRRAKEALRGIGGEQ